MCFDKPTQTKLWMRLGELLAPNGYLCIGHSERVAGLAEQLFHSAGITAYQKDQTHSATTMSKDRSGPNTSSVRLERCNG